MFGYLLRSTLARTRPAGARAKWGWDANFMSGFFGAEGRARGRWRAGRMFEQGDLRYVVLRLLEEKPRHGYEIIKALEERFGGAYAPEPGRGLPDPPAARGPRLRPRRPGRRGEEGLRDHRCRPRAPRREPGHRRLIFDRIGKLVGHFLDEPMTEIHGAFRDVGRATYGCASEAVGKPEVLKQVSEILKRAAKEIEDLPR